MEARLPLCILLMELFLQAAFASVQFRLLELVLVNSPESNQLLD